MIAFSPMPEKVMPNGTGGTARLTDIASICRVGKNGSPGRRRRKKCGDRSRCKKTIRSASLNIPGRLTRPGFSPACAVLEIGGGLSGFQFVLDQHGCQVVNVDPGMAGEGWPCDQNSMAKLNQRFGSHVELRNTTVDKANLPDGSVDRVFSISVIKHLPKQTPARSCAMRIAA